MKNKTKLIAAVKKKQAYIDKLQVKLNGLSEGNEVGIKEEINASITQNNFKLFVDVCILIGFGYFVI